jgi:predicted protein tyrosine phosphatase
MAILVCALSRVPQLVSSRRPSHVVSLLDPRTTFPALDDHRDGRHLQMTLHDIDAPIEGHTHPEAEHIREIIAFVSRWPKADPILIHCYAGISRSSATAFITACVHNPRADEEEIAWTLRRASANAAPNRRIIALADAELGRGGRMVRAVAAIGPAAARWPDITENTPFEIAALHGPSE